MSPHPEIIALQQKFSFPVACLVFGLIGLAVGLTVARDGKLAGFVVGIVIIFAYYVVMFLSESLTKGHYLNPHLSRWVPNIDSRRVRRRGARSGARASRAPETSLHRCRLGIRARPTRAPTRPEPVTADAAQAEGRRARDPDSAHPGSDARPARSDTSPGGTCGSPASRSLALLALFYISTFLDKSDKIFKGQATASSVGVLLLYMTPQFVYFVIPIAALLSVLVTFGALVTQQRADGHEGVRHQSVPRRRSPSSCCL